MKILKTKAWTKAETMIPNRFGDTNIYHPQKIIYISPKTTNMVQMCQNPQFPTTDVTHLLTEYCHQMKNKTAHVLKWLTFILHPTLSLMSFLKQNESAIFKQCS